MRSSSKKRITAIAKLPDPVQVVERRIYMIRGQKVMLDADLAELYQVPTKRVNEQDVTWAGFPRILCFAWRQLSSKT